LINTEIGWQTTTSEEHSYVPDEKTRAEYLLKAAAIDASYGISTNFFELFEKAIGKKFSLINEENKPKEGLKKLEDFNRYLEFLKSKETTENWIETKKESLKERTKLIFQGLYNKVFPERTLNINFLDFQAFLKYCQDKKLSLPAWKKPEEIFFNCFKEKNMMNHLINEGRFYEILNKHIEFSEKRKEMKTKEEVAERTIVKIGAHEIRYNLHEEGLIEPITSEALLGYEELQKEYKEHKKSLEKEKMPPPQIPEECDVMMIEQTVEKLWDKDIKDMDLISKIIRYGDGSKIGAISNLLKEERLTTQQLLEKIKEIFTRA
jgi:hypothetical protein